MPATKSTTRGLRRALPNSRRSRLGNRGQSAVEFLIALPLVLFLLSGIVEFGRHYYTKLTLKHAVGEAARFAITGNTLPDSLGNQMTRAQSIIQTITDKAGDLQVDVNNLVITPSDGGGPGEVVTIAATYRYQFYLTPIAKLFGNGALDFTVSTTMINEPSF